MTVQPVLDRENRLAKSRQVMQRHVERISQAVVSVRPSQDYGAFESIRTLLLAWLREKAGQELTDTMLQGGSDSLDLLGAQRVETVFLEEARLWAARQDYQDETVPRRTWVTEAMLAAADAQSLLLGFRLHCVTLGEFAPFSRSVPRFMRNVAEAHCVYLDNVEIDLVAQAVDTQDDATDLIRFITDPTRKSPVIGISTSPTTEGEQGLVDADRLASAVFGVGHVRRLSRAASFALTDGIGKRFSVFNEALRIWWPNLHPDDDDPYNHPLWLADRIRADGTQAIMRSVVDRVLRSSAGRRDADQVIPSFAEARRAAATILRQRATKESQAADNILPLYEEENLRLTEQIKELRADHETLVAMADEDVRIATADRDAARGEIYALRARIAEMERALRAREQKPGVEIPSDFENFEAWTTRYVSETLDILPRALGGAKKSTFENPALAYQALLLLHEVYVPMRRSGSPVLKDRWDSGLSQLGLECVPTHSGTRAGENPDDYFVRYDGKKVEIDMHLKGSNSRDPRYCFRLYFFWHERSARAVVAWLPSHLGTRIS